MEVQCLTMKVAWIHDGPTGVASNGHFDCPCGGRIDDVPFADGQVHQHSCGRKIDSKGWLV